MSVLDEKWRVGGVAGMWSVLNENRVIAELEYRSSYERLPQLERTHLSSAAPDLYRALKAVEYGEDGCVGCGDNAPSHEDGCEVAAALAKAEGR